MSFGIGKFIGKLVTAPIKIVASPFRVIQDVVESNQDNLIKTVTDSIENQVKEIIDD